MHQIELELDFPFKKILDITCQTWQEYQPLFIFHKIDQFKN